MGLFHPAFLAYVVSWVAFVVVIFFMGYEKGDNKGKPRRTKRRNVQGMLDEKEALNFLLYPFIIVVPRSKDWCFGGQVTELNKLHG